MRTIWFLGHPGSGKTTLARALQKSLGGKSVLLDSDDMRNGPMMDLGFSEDDRQENIERLAKFAQILASRGAQPIVAAITPRQRQQEAAQVLCDPILVYLHGRSSGLWPGTVFEPPTSAKIVLNTAIVSITGCLENILESVRRYDAVYTG